MNCAADVFETCFCAASDRGIRGAIKGGRLKEANMVRQSLAAKSAYVGPGTGRAEPVPKRRVNWLSLYKHSDKFAALVPTNLEAPEEVVDADLLLRTDLVVSIVLAVK